MTGIAGIVRFDDRPIDPDRLDAMLDRVQHRGPLGRGQVIEGRGGVGATRLPVLDVMAAPQPLHLPREGQSSITTGGQYLVYNGEVYNHRYQRKTLERRGKRFRSDHADTETVLMGYRQWGARLPKHVHGMFAMAIWDADAQVLFLCRDRTGKKPLYLCRRRSEFLFASLPSAVVAAAPGADWRVERDALRTYLRYGYTFEPAMLDGLWELPPAHTLELNAKTGDIRVERFWRPPPISKHSTALGAADALEEVIHEAVVARMEADTPLGVMIAGGASSTLIAAIAQQQMAERGERLKTYAAPTMGAGIRVPEAAAAVAKALGTDHTLLPPEPDAGRDATLRGLIELNGQPIADPLVLHLHHVFQSAAETQEVRVALSGVGGAELFGRHRRYAWMEQLRKGRWLHAAKGKVAGNEEALHRAAQAGADPAAQYHALICVFDPQDVAALLGDPPGADPGGDEAPGFPVQPDRVHAAMRWDLEHELPFRMLRVLDRASMAVAVEVRCPMLDTSVMDLAGHLPPRVLMPKGKPEGLLLEVASRYVPKMPKMPPPHRVADPRMSAWINRAAEDRLLDGPGPFGLNTAHIRGVYNRDASRRRDRQLFALLALAYWEDSLANR